ncbi:MAG TPA: T9SS type A sorting domain-containing protein, partial [Prolixibacteraceae bacterium]|nr:T9SS type A sorting domain-containing protein [Prolixibacteraceae bacterium]
SGVFLNGSFCSWNPSDAVRLEENGSVYSSSLQLKKGETIEYKFVNGAADNWAKYELLPGLECAFGNDANRALVVPDYDLLLDLVCFESCSVCKTNSVVEYISESITVSPNPAKDELNIRGLNFGTNKIMLCSIDGQVLKTCTIKDVDSYVLGVSAVLPGVYYLIIIDSDNKAETFKILKE